MLFSCSTCGSEVEAGSVQPDLGTAVCPEHGAVRPHMGHPIGDETELVSRSEDWSTVWSRRASSYRYKASIHPSLRATFAPFSWQGGVGAMSATGEPLAFVVGLPLLGLAYALTYTPRFFAPRISIDRHRVRFGLRSLRLKDVGSFVVVTRKRASDLATRAQDVALLNCARPAEALFALRDELNEALFVVQHQTPRPEARTPYRG